jgi:hypothetical protein
MSWTVGMHACSSRRDSGSERRARRRLLRDHKRPGAAQRFTDGLVVQARGIQHAQVDHLGIHPFGFRESCCLQALEDHEGVRDDREPCADDVRSDDSCDGDKEQFPAAGEVPVPHRCDEHLIHEPPHERLGDECDGLDENREED